MRVLFVLSALLASSLFVGPYLVRGQLDSADNAIGTSNIGVKITSLKTNQTVPIGQLTIYGTSSDTSETNCQVYVDWNDVKPMQNVTGIGPGGLGDYSNWTFTYNQKYHPITEGINELTSKISCYSNSNIGNITTKYYSVNVTGSNNPSPNIPTASVNPSPDPTTIRYHSIIPQYSNKSDNKGENSSEVKGLGTNTYIEISSGYTGNNKQISDKKDNQKIEFHTMSSVISSNIEKIKDGQNDLNIKWYNGKLNHQDLGKYIHNLIKEKLNKISDRLRD